MRPDPTIALAVDRRPVAQRIAIEIVAASPLRPDDVDFWHELWERICDGADCGLLLDSNAPPQTSYGRMLSHAHFGASSLRYELELTGVGPSGWKVVLQLLIAASQSSALLASASITASGVPRSIDAAHVLRAAYEPARHVSFPIQRDEEGDATRDRITQITFTAQPTAPAREAIQRGMEAWMALANGGFPEPGKHPWENACDATEFEWTAPAVIQCMAPSYLGDEAAFDAMVNMAATISSKFCPVQHVFIA